MAKANQKSRDNLAKQILDKYATFIIRKNAIYVKDGVAGVDQNKGEDYTPDKYKGDEVLWIPPPDCIRVEFEDEPDRNLKYIREMEASVKSFPLEYCISDHGGKSQYLNLLNLKGIPLNEDNKLAKDLLIDALAPQDAKNFIDKTNLGRTLSPVFEHPHWKPKYNGAIHKIIRGKNPLEHENKYPKELLKLLEKSKRTFKKAQIKIKLNNKWVEDFLINYCTEHELSKGNRHFIIEKNLAALIIYRPDREAILDKYLRMQGRKSNTLRTWFNTIIKGRFNEVSPGELVNYIKNNNLPFEIPAAKAAAPAAEPATAITAEEKQILSNPKLLDLIVKEIQEKRVVGEEETIGCIFIVTNCRLVKNIKATSSNLNVNDESGLGKDWIVKAVLDILPDNVVVYRTKITPELLTYWHNAKYEPEWTWNGKILYIEDISSVLLNSDVFKVFSSGGSKATVLIKQYPVDIIIDGKPSMIVTSYHINPNNENLRRYPICFCDSSEEQTLEIMKRQSIEDATGEIYSYNPELKTALSKLRRVTVIVPFAKELPEFFPKNKFMRTHYKRFLDYIKSSAALHQFQREKDGYGTIIATGKDYDIARKILLKNTNNPSMIPLTREQDNIFNFFKENADKWYSVNDIESNFPISSEWLRKQLKNLYKYGFLQSQQKERDGVKRKVTEYSFSSKNIVEIPLYNIILEDSSFNTINTINQNNTINTINNQNTSI